MSNADGNNLDPKKENLPGDDDLVGGLGDLELPGLESQDPLGDLGGAGAFGEGAPLGDLPAMEATGEIGQPAAGLPEAAPEEALEESPEDAKGKKKKRRPRAAKEKKEKGERAPLFEGLGIAGMAVLGFSGLSILLLLVLDAVAFLGHGFLFLLLINVFWLMATAIPFIMWMGRKTLNFYEVVLGISLAGIVIAVSLLAAEWLVQYKGESKPQVGAATISIQSGAERIIAVA